MTDFPEKKKINWLFWLFAAFGLAGVISVIFIAIAIMNVGGSNRNDAAPLAVEEGQREYRMGDVIDLRGNDLSAITITSGADNYRGSGSFQSRSSGVTIHNIILFNRETAESRRILPSNDGQIVSGVFLPDQQSGHPLAIGNEMADAANVAEAVADAAMEAAGLETVSEREEYRRKLPLKFYIAIIANQKGEQIRKNLLIGRLNDGRQANLMEGIESVERFWILSPTELGLIVQEKGQIFHRVINFETLKTTRSTKIEVN